MPNLGMVECSYGIYERRGLKCLYLLLFYIHCVAEELHSGCGKETMPRLGGFTTKWSTGFGDSFGAHHLCILMAGGHAVT